MAVRPYRATACPETRTKTRAVGLREQGQDGLDPGERMDHHLAVVEILSEAIKIRVTEDDRAAFAAAPTAEGLSLSAWARRHLKRIAMKGDRKSG